MCGGAQEVIFVAQKWPKWVSNEEMVLVEVDSWFANPKKERSSMQLFGVGKLCNGISNGFINLIPIAGGLKACKNDCALEEVAFVYIKSYLLVGTSFKERLEHWPHVVWHLCYI